MPVGLLQVLSSLSRSSFQVFIAQLHRSDKVKASPIMVYRQWQTLGVIKIYNYQGHGSSKIISECLNDTLFVISHLGLYSLRSRTYKTSHVCKRPKVLIEADVAYALSIRRNRNKRAPPAE